MWAHTPCAVTPYTHTFSERFLCCHLYIPRCLPGCVYVCKCTHIHRRYSKGENKYMSPPNSDREKHALPLRQKIIPEAYTEKTQVLWPQEHREHRNIIHAVPVSVCLPQTSSWSPFLSLSHTHTHTHTQHTFFAFPPPPGWSEDRKSHQESRSPCSIWETSKR